MSWAKEFDRDLSLHVLIICNKNTVAILHGEKLAKVDGLKEYIVKRKKNDVPFYPYRTWPVRLGRGSCSCVAIRRVPSSIQSSSDIGTRSWP
jgi:hypothetical protein